MNYVPVKRCENTGTPMPLFRLWMLTAALSVWSTTTLAQSPADFANRSPWVASVRGGAIQQFSTNLATGGSYSVRRGFVEPGLSYVLGPLGSVGLRIGYGYSDYTFSSVNVQPWNDVNDISISIPIRWAVSDTVQVFAVPTLRFDYETGAKAKDGFTGGAIIAAGWRINDSLFIGPGAGVFSGLGEDVNIFPVIALDWEISDTLALRTGSGLGASRGPGLTLEWDVSETWRIGLGGRYEKIRFRLDDRGPTPGGIGEDRAAPLFLTASWNPSERASLTAIAGVETSGRLSLEDSAGRVVSRTEYDPGTFFGFAFNLRF